MSTIGRDGFRARLALGLAAAALLAGVFAVPTAGAQQDDGRRTYVFGAEGNRLNAYDVTDPGLVPAPKQTLRPSGADDPVNGIDINAQICFFPDGSHRFVAGEDTNQPNPPPGWGIFQLHGDQLGSLSITQVGKLTPTYQEITDPATSVPDNYGCGFLSDGRIVTSDIGNNLPGFEGNGQLIVWFPPFDVMDTVDEGDTLDNHCILDIGIATAGGIHVDDQDNVYVASNRPDTTPPVLSSGGVYRYSGSIPTSPAECGDINPATGLAPGITKELFIPGETPFALTPSAIAPSGHGTYYVSSVFSGTIAEFDANGIFQRMILQPPPGETPPFSTGTPYGISVDSDGTLYYADLGVGIGPPPGPEDGQGSEFRIRFVDGNPQAPEMLDDGLDFPDGSGVLEIVPPQAQSPTPTLPAPTSGCPVEGAAMTPAVPTGAAAAVGVAPLGLAALRRRRRRPAAGNRQARVRSVVTWLMVAGVGVAVLAGCRPVKPPTVGC